MTPQNLRILLVEDNDIYRRGLRELLASAGGVEVVGEAATAEDAVREAASLRPNVVVMDLRIGERDGSAHLGAGLRALRSIVDRHPEAGVLVLSTLPSAPSVLEAVAGAHGRLMSLDKNATAVAILAAIYAVDERFG